MAAGVNGPSSADQFMTYGADGANNTQMSPQLIELYDKLHLMRTVNNRTWAKYGQERFIASRSGVKQGFAFRYNNLALATTPLTEGITPGGSNITREKVAFRVEQFGDYVEYTDQLDLFDVDNIKSEFLDILGDQAAHTLDVVVRDGIIGGTNVIFANGAADRTALAAAVGIAGLATEADYATAELRLRKAKAKKFKGALNANKNIATAGARDAYICLIDPNRTQDFRYARNADGTLFYPNFLSIEQYPNQAAAEEYEIGRMGSVCFSETDQAALDDTGLRDVYLDIVFGKDAYCNVSVNGKGGTQTIVKPLGSGGSYDPLDQRGTIGWKAYSGSRILNNTFMVRVESGSMYDVSYDLATGSVTDGADTFTTDPGTGVGTGNPVPTGTATTPAQS